MSACRIEFYLFIHTNEELIEMTLKLKWINLKKKKLFKALQVKALFSHLPDFFFEEYLMNANY